MKKRILSMVLVGLMLLTLMPVIVIAWNWGDEVQISKHTIVDTMTHNGVTVDSYYTPKFPEYDNDTTYCCAALVKRFYNNVYGLTVWNLYPSADKPMPSVDRGTFVLTDTPNVGDIAASAGHWAIVKSIVSSNEVMLFEQNYWKNETTAYCHRVLSKNSDGVWECGKGQYYSTYWFWHYVCDQHQFTTESVAASEKSDGYDKEYCTVCGYVSKNEVLHNWQDKEIIKEKTTTDDVGLTTVSMLYRQVCTNCQMERTKQKFHFYGTSYIGPDWKEMAWEIIVNAHANYLEIRGDIYNGFKELKELIGSFGEDFWKEITGSHAPGKLKLSGMTTIPDSFLKDLAISIGEIELSTDVKNIGGSAFSGCADVESIVIPDSVGSIGSGAFFNCTALKRIKMPISASINFDTSYNNRESFDGCSSIEEVIFTAGRDGMPGNGADKSYHQLFSGSRATLKSIRFEEGIKTIPEDICYWCGALTSVYLPSTLTSIGRRAFIGCANLNNITIPDSVTEIGEKAFAECKSVKSLTLPKNITVINGSTFYGCRGLCGEIVIPSGVTYIGESAFGDCGIESIVIADGVKGISNYTFGGCSNLKRIKMPISASINFDTSYNNRESFDGCSSIEEVIFTAGRDGMPGNGADKSYHQLFSGSRATLKSIRFEEGIKTIPEDICYWCGALTSVYLPSTLTSIGRRAFIGCANLNNITIPDSVTEIGEKAFAECKSVKSLTLPKNITVINGSTFYGCRGLCGEIVIPSGVTYIGESAFGDCGIESIVIADGVKGISNYTFGGCSNLKRIKMPISASINFDTSYNNRESFDGCSSIEEVIFTAGRDGMPGNGADKSYHQLFSGSRATLKSIRFEEGIKTIPEGICYECGALTSVYLPSTLTSIGWSAFNGCANLNNITIPDSVTEIGEKAFNCTAITDVYFGGTKEQWKMITIKSYNDPLKNAAIHYTDAVPSDLNGDGKVNVMDLIRLKRYLADGTEVVGNADVNGDGKVNVMDLIRLKRYIAGEAVDIY